MAESTGKKEKISTLESELYLLIAKFLRAGPCKESAKLLVEEIEEHQLLPKRVDWLGNEHSRSFNELDTQLSLITDDHLLKICSQIGPILDKELPSTVPGLTSLLGVGKQSLLRTKEDLLKPKCQLSNLIARKNGMPFLPSNSAQSTYPPNIAQVLISRETSGAVSCKHTFTPKIYARQQIYRRLLGHLSSVYCVLFDRTGKYIFTGADDLLVKVWSAQDGRLLAALRGHSAEITDMAVNHENTLLAAGSCDKTIRVWCLRSTAPVAVLSGHTGMVTSLQFCPYPKNDDRLLISTGNDGCVCFWHWNPKNNAFNPKPLRFTERNKANAQMICSSFSSGGLFLATGSTDNNVRIYNIAGSNGPEKILERELHTDRVDSLQFSNHDCRCVSGSKDGTALIWKYERQNWTNIVLKMSTKLPGQSEEPEDTTKLKLRVTMVGWTLDDEKVITAVSDHSIKVWNSYTGNLNYILKGHEDEVFVLEPHPIDSRVFLSSGHDGRIIIWDLMTGTVIKNHFNLIEGQGHGAVFDCKFSPDGLMFASTDSHGHLSVFGFGSAEPYKKVPEEQFFHTDYRPLIRDIHHHVLDEQTQTAPHLLPPPFLVDIDGNPYPPNLQRLVPGREHHNDSQLVPYVAGDNEILEPVRPANDNRPTIDDMIERLQYERQQSLEQANEHDPQRIPIDALLSPQSSHRSVNGERSGADPFSPRTPRSQAGHSRVGLRRTGDVEGVQSVGHWQTRNVNADIPSRAKRAVVKAMRSSLFKYHCQTRVNIADKEVRFFNKEKKKRPLLPERNEESSQESINSCFQRRRGNRAGLRSTVQEDENQENGVSSSSSSETEQQDDMTESDSEYSDWVEDEGVRQPKPRPEPPASTSGTTRRSASTRQIKPRHRLVSSDELGSDEEEEDDETPTDEESSTPKKPKRKMPTPSKKKPAVNGKKLPERFRPPEWLTGVVPCKAPYVPQIGDEVMYFRQGHELYVQAVRRNQVYDISMKSQPWRKTNLRDQEVARIEDITFENHPPRLCCLQLTLLNPASKYDESFSVKYHDMADVIDFIVLKQNYDQAMYYDWKSGDRFRSAIDKAWWLGTIKAQKPLNPNFPDSMFQCFLVKWDNGEKEHMSPWDFEPIDNERLPEEDGGSVDITPEERTAMMYVPDPQEWSNYGRDHDCDRIARGLTRIMELSIADPFTSPVDLNQYPSYAIVVEYPMDLGTIKSRVENRFYRRSNAIKFDVRYIEVNAQKFNEPGSRIVKQAKCVVDLCVKFIEAPYCSDPMTIYNEMMEAKQSRSQDSQSELDVLCSEIDSDGDNNSNRIKRKKQNALQNSSKRVRLENQRYTSSSWQQQCSALLDTFYQCEDSTPFRQPVSLTDYPDYRNIIDIPMDLSKVREKLNNKFYNSPTDFCKDMRSIFQNSRNYNTNKKSRIYSMTIRLSAMFEEHIRSIYSDWRSAVIYEEKKRNNQFVSSRRKPLPVHEADVNIGASTSRGHSTNAASSSRNDRSRHSGSRTSSSLFLESSSSRTRRCRTSNGTSPRKKMKHKGPVSSKTTLSFKRKISKPTTGSLTNGTSNKRKLNDRSPKKLGDRPKKKDSYNEDPSPSDSPTSSNSSSENNNHSDEWNRKSKKRRKDVSAPTKRGRPVQPIRTRPVRTVVASRFNSGKNRWSKRCVRSLSPENVSKTRVSAKISPLQTRSKRLRPIRKPVYHQDYVTGESSESEEEEDAEARNSKSLKNSSSASQEASDKEDNNSDKSYSSSEGEQQHQSPLKAGIRTRNRGQRTVRYREEESENEASRQGNKGRRSVKNREELGENEESSQASTARGRRSLKHKEESEGNDESSQGANTRMRRTVQYKEDSEGNDESSQTGNTRTRRTVKYKEDSDNDESSQMSSSRTRRTARYKEDSEENDESSQMGSTRTKRTSRYKEDSEENDESSLTGNSRTRRTVKYKEDSDNDESSQMGSTRTRRTAKYKEDSEENDETSQTGSTRTRRTSRYKEDSEENDESSQMGSTRTRKLVRYKEVDSEDNEESTQATLSRSLRSQAYGDEQHLGIPKNEGCARKANTTGINGKGLASTSYSNRILKLGRQSLTEKRAPFHPTSGHQRTRSAQNVNGEKQSLRTKVNAYKVRNASAGLRKCSKLIKRSVLKKPYSPLSCIQMKAGDGLRNAKNHWVRSRSTARNTRSQHQTGERTCDKVTSKPTIVICKQSVAECEAKSKMKLSSDHNYDCKSKISSDTEGGNNLTSTPISSHTRISLPRFSEMRKKSILLKKQIAGGTLKRSRTLSNLSIKMGKFSSSPASKILQSNKSKWCLRKPNTKLRLPQHIESDKVQTRNRGQRTVVYDEDDNYFNEILENEDPVKVKQQHDIPASDKKDEQDSVVRKSKSNEKCSNNNEHMAGNSKQNSVVTVLRAKKEALKILSNGIETRNHGQRTTVYAEDGDDYLEQYFDNLDS